jgi:DtxR family Mn-dependent transcriptional regulator
MLQKLAAQKPPLITYRKHHGARLTESGERAALEVIRHHRLLETWLVQVLGYSWDDVHGEAEKLEHVMSEDLERRISRALGNPARDPHGEPIPSATLIMPAEHSVPLADLRVGQEAVVRRVQPGDAAALRHLHGLGIFIGSQFKVISVSDYDNVMTLQIPGQDRSITLGPALLDLVFVELRISHKKGSKATS